MTGDYRRPGYRGKLNQLQETHLTALAGPFTIDTVAASQACSGAPSNQTNL